MKNFGDINQHKKILVIFLLLHSTVIFSMRMALVKGQQSQQKKIQITPAAACDQQKDCPFFALQMELQERIVSYLNPKDAYSVVTTCLLGCFTSYNKKNVGYIVANNPVHEYHSLLINMCMGYDHAQRMATIENGRPYHLPWGYSYSWPSEIIYKKDCSGGYKKDRNDNFIFSFKNKLSGSLSSMRAA